MYFRFVNKKSLKVIGFGFNRWDIGFSVASIVLMPSALIAYMALLSSQGLVSAEFNGNFFLDLQVIPLFLIIVLAWIMAAFSEELVLFLLTAAFYCNNRVRKPHSRSSIHV